MHDPTYIFDGTNYDVWKIRMLNLFRAIGPKYIERIIDVGFPPPKNSQELSLEDEENSHLDTLVANGLICVLSDAVLASIMPFRSAHELWTKLQDIYEVSNIIEDDCSPSTSGRDEFTTSSTSPTCDSSQSNEMVSGDRNCFVDGEYSIHYTSYLSHCNVLSLDLNSSSTPNVIHARVDSPCISCNSCLTKSHDDMLSMSCCHENNASIPSSACMTNNVEESQHLLEQDMDINGASSNSSLSLSTTHLCLMARDSKVSPPLEPSTPCDVVDEDSYEELMDVESITMKGELVLGALPKGSKAISPLCEIIAYAIKSREFIESLSTQFEEKCQIERDDSITIASLKASLLKKKSIGFLLRRDLILLMSQMILLLLKSLRKEIMLLKNIKCLKGKRLNLVLSMFNSKLNFLKLMCLAPLLPLAIIIILLRKMLG